MLRARRSQSCKRRKALAAEPRPMGTSPLSIDAGGVAEGDGGALKGQRAPHWNQRMPMPAKTTE
jgi:hypothetical protein